MFTGFSPTRYFYAGHRASADVDRHHTTGFFWMTSDFSASMDWGNGVFMPYLLSYSDFIQRLSGLRGTVL
ncbi:MULTISPECIES: hypothetical protein [unclassified Pseudomonas]|uniref:hypothetical protein n=1 Tax=unclassified Pseudomonas TaxID=196821 RepID=UPI0011136766|nr:MULTISPECIES: hypothetical protein [unclassified Pseudomonas]